MNSINLTITPQLLQTGDTVLENNRWFETENQSTIP